MNYQSFLGPVLNYVTAYCTIVETFGHTVGL